MSQIWTRNRALVRESYADRWRLIVHLRELQQGREFYVVARDMVADEEGGWVRNYELPDGVLVDALRELIAEIGQRRRELTDGSDEAREFWESGLAARLRELECSEVNTP